MGDSKTTNFSSSNFYAIMVVQESSTSSIVTHKSKKKQHAHVSSGLRNHYSELFTWMAGLIFKKSCNTAAIAAITQFVTDLALLTEQNQQLKDQLNWHNHSQESTSPRVLMIVSVVNSQYSTYTCINTSLSIVQICLYYGELVILGNIILICFPTVPIILQIHTFYHKTTSIGVVFF